MAVHQPDCSENHAFKIVVGSLSSVTLIIIGLFVNVAWSTAEKGEKLAASLEPRVAVVEASVQAINKDTARISKVTEDIQKDVKDEFIPKMLAYAERRWREELSEGEKDEMQLFGEACAIMREHADYFSKMRFPG